MTALFVPSLFYIPISMIIISFLAYQPTLFGVEPVSMALLALGVFLLLTRLVVHVAPILFKGADKGRDSTPAVESGT